MTDIVERRAQMRWPKSISGPIRVERHDCESGLIAYEIWDHGPATYHRLCTVYEETGLNAKAEAEFVALAINNALGALMAIEAAERTDMAGPNQQAEGAEYWEARWRDEKTANERLADRIRQLKLWAALPSPRQSPAGEIERLRQRLQAAEMALVRVAGIYHRGGPPA